MKTIRHNGEFWYEDKRSLWLRIRKWLFWIGGWEKLNHQTGRSRWEPVTRWSDPFPVSLLGHRFTFFSWGMQVRLPRRYFVWCYRRKPGVAYGPLGVGYAYLSRDGTPHEAHHWLWGWEKSYEWMDIRRALVEREAWREQMARKERAHA